MSHKQKVLALLSDGKPHQHHELYALGCIAHSRVADLRRDGHRIECRTETVHGERVSVYQLRGGVLDASPGIVPSSLGEASSTTALTEGVADEPTNDLGRMPAQVGTPSASAAVSRSGYVYPTPAFQERSPERARGVGAADAVAANGLEQLVLTVPT